MRTGVIAKKIGMSRIFKDDGSNIPVTVLQMDNCTVIQKKVENLDGYNAVSVSYGNKEKNANPKLVQQTIQQVTHKLQQRLLEQQLQLFSTP